MIYAAGIQAQSSAYFNIWGKNYALQNRDVFMIAIIFVPFMILGILGIMWILNNKSWKSRQDPFAYLSDDESQKTRTPSEDEND